MPTELYPCLISEAIVIQDSKALVCHPLVPRQSVGRAAEYNEATPWCIYRLLGEPCKNPSVRNLAVVSLNPANPEEVTISPS
jgi:hypothetical protein